MQAFGGKDGASGALKYTQLDIWRFSCGKDLSLEAFGGRDADTDFTKCGNLTDGSLINIGSAFLNCVSVVVTNDFVCL